MLHAQTAPLLSFTFMLGYGTSNGSVMLPFVTVASVDPVKSPLRHYDIQPGDAIVKARGVGMFL